MRKNDFKRLMKFKQEVRVKQKGEVQSFDWAGTVD